MILKPKELQLLKLVCQDKSNMEIAEAMGLTLRTMEKMKSRVYQKTGAQSNLSLYRWSLINGYAKLKIKATRKPAAPKKAAPKKATSKQTPRKAKKKA